MKDSCLSLRFEAVLPSSAATHLRTCCGGCLAKEKAGSSACWSQNFEFRFDLSTFLPQFIVKLIKLSLIQREQDFFAFSVLRIAASSLLVSRLSKA